MAIATLDKTDALIRDAVTRQLEWDSEVDSRDIAATVRNGVVTVTGYIGSYAGKLAAERAVKRVRGVRVVANAIQVRLRLERPDPDLAADIAAMLKLRSAIPQSVQAAVHNGHVALTGTVPTLLIAAVTANAVRHIDGVKGIANQMRVLPVATTGDLRRCIGQALQRSAEVDARNLTIVIEGSTVTLNGDVDSWAEAEAAERAVMHAPGVTEIDNRIRVSARLVPVHRPASRFADVSWLLWLALIVLAGAAAPPAFAQDPPAKTVLTAGLGARAPSQIRAAPPDGEVSETPRCASRSIAARGSRCRRKFPTDGNIPLPARGRGVSSTAITKMSAARALRF